MLDIDKFLKGEIAYVIDRDTEDSFLNELESQCDIKWLSGDKPTKYKAYWMWYNEGEDVVIGVCTVMGVWGIGHGCKDDFENYRVEVFKIC